MCLYLVLYIVLNTKCITDHYFVSLHEYGACLPASVHYTHMRLHIHNLAYMILYVTCYKRLGWRGCIPALGFKLSRANLTIRFLSYGIIIIIGLFGDRIILDYCLYAKCPG